MPELQTKMVAHCVLHRIHECRKAGQSMAAIVLHPAICAQLRAQAAPGEFDHSHWGRLSFHGVLITPDHGAEYPHILMVDETKEFI